MSLQKWAALRNLYHSKIVIFKEKYSELIEEMLVVIEAEERKDGETVTLEELKAELRPHLSLTFLYARSTCYSCYYFLNRLFD